MNKMSRQQEVNNGLNEVSEAQSLMAELLEGQLQEAIDRHLENRELDLSTCNPQDFIGAEEVVFNQEVFLVNNSYVMAQIPEGFSAVAIDFDNQVLEMRTKDLAIDELQDFPDYMSGNLVLEAGGTFALRAEGTENDDFYVVKKANISDKSFTAYKLSRDVIEPVHRAIVQNAFDKQDIDVERINAGTLTDTCFDVKFNFNQLLTITR